MTGTSCKSLLSVVRSRLFLSFPSETKSISDLWHTVNCFFPLQNRCPKNYNDSCLFLAEIGPASMQIYSGMKKVAFFMSTCSPFEWRLVVAAKLLLPKVFYHHRPCRTILPPKNYKSTCQNGPFKVVLLPLPSFLYFKVEYLARDSHNLMQ